MAQITRILLQGFPSISVSFQSLPAFCSHPTTTAQCSGIQGGAWTSPGHLSLVIIMLADVKEYKEVWKKIAVHSLERVSMFSQNLEVPIFGLYIAFLLLFGKRTLFYGPTHSVILSLLISRFFFSIVW